MLETTNQFWEPSSTAAFVIACKFMDMIVKVYTYSSIGFDDISGYKKRQQAL